MCSKDETVLSDVHMTVSYNDSKVVNDCQLLQHRLPDLKVVQSRFTFRTIGKPYDKVEGSISHPAQPTSALLGTTGSRSAQEADNRVAVYDKDGDLVYLNRETYGKEVIIIDHCMATPLSLVGLQVWQGSLILADYFLHVGKSLLENCRLIELGAGTGFCSLVAAIYAEAVILTDYDEDILDLCQRNVHQNSHLLKATTQVKKLDWCRDITSQSSHDPRWKMEHKDLESANLNTVIAADVIYRDDLTDALFRTVDKLMEGTVEFFYLALEKRLNFTIEDLDVACPAYEHYLTCVNKHNYILQKLETDFPQYLDYNRTPQLELWVLKKKKKT